ncbi:hypothetical protein SS05631_c13690 [Sinorhizobium sp. CCBAU 05631]|nr:hypothetical protein SS05631_c13690 [Sinorhizobium sp. CCBAU 05631]
MYRARFVMEKLPPNEFQIFATPTGVYFSARQVHDIFRRKEH